MDLRKLLKTFQELEKKARKNEEISKGEQTAQFYRGVAEAYEDARNRLAETMAESTEEPDAPKDYEALLSRNTWRGLAVGILIGSTIFTMLIQWIMSLLG